MRPGFLLAALAWLMTSCAQTPSPASNTPMKSSAQLLRTYWKLTNLGGQAIESPAGAREIHLVLDPENQRVSGFSGCNRMMGGYALNGDALKFDQIAGTMMACVSGMDVEKKFLAMFGQVARWEIKGETLQLFDAGGKPLATFEARAP